ncbi:hypothetical protein EJB05_45891, partial [Eragrostis curvula]
MYPQRLGAIMPQRVSLNVTDARSGEAFIASLLGKMVKFWKREKQENRRLVFVGKRDGAPWQHGFDLEDLLRASAEALGKGSLGTSYKTMLEEMTVVVVKRLRNVAASREEFTACVEVVGGVEHLNLAPVRGYVYSKDECLLVGDYFPAGSLSDRLHGSRGTDDRTPMDWEARICAALCAARGVAHLHTVPGLAHGNVKSSNLLLRTDIDAAALTDYCLNQLFAPAPASPGGYRAPELMDARRPTFKSDVYSLGVLFLELLTGKFPDGNDAFDLPRWVMSVMKEEWVLEALDAELLRRLAGNAEEGMLKLLLLAIKCVAPVPGARPDADDVVKGVEEIVEEQGSTATEKSQGTHGASEEEEQSKGTTL